ncbi:hypothetical protein Fot_35237 [Forsythia ovata]|uniref:Uncharacterized protein n=1 Tax=Forsythia ovata TaxID=205694 RepID=A0ABD1SME8_9LAMI
MSSILGNICSSKEFIAHASVSTAPEKQIKAVPARIIENQGILASKACGASLSYHCPVGVKNDHGLFGESLLPSENVRRQGEEKEVINDGRNILCKKGIWEMMVMQWILEGLSEAERLIIFKKLEGHLNLLNV